MKRHSNALVTLASVLTLTTAEHTFAAEDTTGESATADLQTLSPPAAPALGRYVSERVPPGFTFEVGEGWSGSEIPPGDLVALYIGEEAALIPA